MSKKPSEREEALEIIELATDDIESLTRAFELIQEVVTHADETRLELSEQSEFPVIH